MALSAGKILRVDMLLLGGGPTQVHVSRTMTTMTTTPGANGLGIFQEPAIAPITNTKHNTTVLGW
jgi:hypothetical protein